MPEEPDSDRHDAAAQTRQRPTLTAVNVGGLVGLCAFGLAKTTMAKIAPKSPHEDFEQRMLAQWLDLKKVVWCHVPNGGVRSWRTAKALKSHGVKAGVPDVLIFSPPYTKPFADIGFVGVALELKRQKGGTVSLAQKQWLEAMEKLGWYTQICKGAGAAITYLRSLGY